MRHLLPAATEPIGDPVPTQTATPYQLSQMQLLPPTQQDNPLTELMDDNNGSSKVVLLGNFLEVGLGHQWGMWVPLACFTIQWNPLLSERSGTKGCP